MEKGQASASLSENPPEGGAEEIPITPEMIEAGIGAYFSFRDGGQDDPPEMVVTEIFQAMISVCGNPSRIE